MSSIDRKTFNEMLRKDKLSFSAMNPIRDASSGYVFKGQRLKAGIDYAFSHLEEIAELEKKFIFNRPQQITIANLKAAKSFIATYKGEPKSSKSTAIRFHWFHPVAEFLIKCHLLALTNPDEFVVYVDDDGRKSQIWLLFGSPINEIAEFCPDNIFQPIKFENESFCTQIIFDSADLPSAMDALFAECWCSAGSPWSIKAVFIQESLREEVIRRLNTNRLDDDGKLVFETNGFESGGKVFLNSEANITLLFDVLPKYVKNKETICINFFRTVADVNQLLAKEIRSKLFSIWTEKIGLFYELASKLNGSIMWSNSVGLIDENTAQTLYGFNDTHQR